jgi:hypothetical protein
MKMGAQQIVIRSNWEGYLNEFATAVQLAHDFCGTNRDTNGTNGSSSASSVSMYIESAKIGPVERTDKSLAMTNFEAKYDKIGEPTYELLLLQSLGLNKE